MNYKTLQIIEIKLIKLILNYTDLMFVHLKNRMIRIVLFEILLIVLEVKKAVHSDYKTENIIKI